MLDHAVHTAAVLALAALVPFAAAAQTPTPPDESVVVVNGEGVVKSTPDRAWVVIGAESRSKDPKEAQAQNATAMRGVQDKLTALGVAKDAVRTAAFDLQLEFDYNNGRQTPRGYVARNSIEVRVDDLTKVGEVIDASIGTGATSVHNLRFDLKQRTSVEREALRLAVADARARAEAIAAGASATLGRIVKVEESGGRFTPPQPMMMARMAAADAAQTPVAPGEIEVRAQVAVTIALR